MSFDLHVNMLRKSAHLWRLTEGSAAFQVTMSTRTWRRQKSAELERVHDPSSRSVHGVAVLKDDAIVGHLPKASVRIYSFLRRGGVIRRKYINLL